MSNFYGSPDLSASPRTLWGRPSVLWCLSRLVIKPTHLVDDRDCYNLWPDLACDALSGLHQLWSGFPFPSPGPKGETLSALGFLRMRILVPARHVHKAPPKPSTCRAGVVECHTCPAEEFFELFLFFVVHTCQGCKAICSCCQTNQNHR